MKIGKHDYYRCSVKMHCPVCGKDKHCLVNADGTYCICTKLAQGAVKKYKVYGWLHKLAGNTYTPSVHVVKSSSFPPDPAYIAEQYSMLDRTWNALRPLADHLKVSVRSLWSLGAGFYEDAWDFPMYDENHVMIGLKRRNTDGQKWCIRHSRLGIYIPASYNPHVPVVINEGESDTAAMISQGYNVIGKASDSTCGDILEKFIKQPAIIFSDNTVDGLAFKYSCELCDRLKDSVVVINLGYKDAREWINSGTFTPAMFASMVQNPAYKHGDKK